MLQETEAVVQVTTQVKDADISRKHTQNAIREKLRSMKNKRQGFMEAPPHRSRSLQEELLHRGVDDAHILNMAGTKDLRKMVASLQSKNV